MVQLADIDVGDIVEIDLPTYNHYKGRAKVLRVGIGSNIYPLEIEYLDSFLEGGVAELLGKKSWIKLSEVVSSGEKELMEKDFRFIKL